MFLKINLESDKYKIFESDKIDNLSKVNLFVGPNNSGKSTLLRSIFTDSEIEYVPSNLDFEAIRKKFLKLRFECEAYFKNSRIRFYQNPISNLEVPKFMNNGFDLEKHFLNPVIGMQDSFKEGPYESPLAARKKLKELGTNAASVIKSLIPNDYSYDFDTLYIPTLRGLRPINAIKTKDAYKERTINDYFKEDYEKFKTKIYTGLTLYDDLKKLLLGKHNDREKVKNFENFLSEQFFRGKSIDLIPHIDSDVVFVKIGNEPDYPIYNLGDGIQSLIVLTYPLFFNADKRLKIFVEEPELYLHPGMQRILLDLISNSTIFTRHQFFISTHSNHFLDMTMDFSNVSVFSARKLPSGKFDITNLDSPDSDILEHLGVKNSSVFLSNCTIWVEGITDRLYIRRYLEMYRKHIGEKLYKEDLHYSFVEYGGGNITHWSFLDDTDPQFPNINVKTLCGKLFLISDRDGAGLKKDGSESKRPSAKHNRHLKLKAKLGANYYCLESREIENSLSVKVLENTIRTLEGRKARNLNFDKLANGKFKTEYLGTFIHKNVTGLTRNYQSPSGTLTQKVKFCKIAIAHIQNFEDLGEEAKKLTRMIYEFIKRQNG